MTRMQKNAQKLKSSLTSGGFSEVLDGNQETSSALYGGLIQVQSLPLHY